MKGMAHRCPRERFQIRPTPAEEKAWRERENILNKHGARTQHHFGEKTTDTNKGGKRSRRQPTRIPFERNPRVSHRELEGGHGEVSEVLEGI